MSVLWFVGAFIDAFMGYSPLDWQSEDMTGVAAWILRAKRNKLNKSTTCIEVYWTIKSQ
jgi:hypothetical protein